MPSPLQIAGQTLLYAAFALVVGHFSHSPAHALRAADEGLLRLSFSHPGKFSTDCRKRSAEELAKLQPQMRAAEDCKRERSAVHVQVAVDGQSLIDEKFSPAGLSRDGAASGYRRLPLPAGRHTIAVSVNDDLRNAEPGWRDEKVMDVAAGQVVLIDFKPGEGGVVIR